MTIQKNEHMQYFLLVGVSDVTKLTAEALQNKDELNHSKGDIFSLTCMQFKM